MRHFNISDLALGTEYNKHLSEAGQKKDSTNVSALQYGLLRSALSACDNGITMTDEQLNDLVARFYSILECDTIKTTIASYTRNRMSPEQTNNPGGYQYEQIHSILKSLYKLRYSATEMQLEFVCSSYIAHDYEAEADLPEIKNDVDCLLQVLEKSEIYESFKKTKCSDMIDRYKRSLEQLVLFQKTVIYALADDPTALKVIRTKFLQNKKITDAQGAETLGMCTRSFLRQKQKGIQIISTFFFSCVNTNSVCEKVFSLKT